MELLSQLGINWQMLIAQIVNFAVVAGVLTMLVYKPLLDVVDKRAERVRKAMDEAKRLEEEAHNMQTVRKDQLKKIDQEAGEILSEARKKAEVVHEQLLEKAKAEVQSLMEKGRRELAQERAEALAEVQDVVAKAVLTLSEKLLEREFSAADQKKAIHGISESIPALLK